MLNSLKWSLFAATLAFSPSFAQNVTQAYTPVSGACPAGFQLVRNAGNVGNQSLNAQEAEYVSKRKTQVLPGAWKSYLQNVQATKVSLPDYAVAILNGSENSTDKPTLGIALSGGGYRAAIFGAGVINALDARNSSANAVGTGGLLQAATYITGLSGGSWLLTSFAQANFPTIQELAFSTGAEEGAGWGGWNAQFDVFAPSNDTPKDTLFILSVLGEIKGKFQAGFPVTINDLWSRVLSRHFVNGTSPTSFFGNATTHGAGVLFSDIANVPNITAQQVPFPLVVTNSKSPNGKAADIGPGAFIPYTNVIYEFSPYEMGSYDPQLSAFTPTKYLGTRNTSLCVTNYDQAAFVLGTSSELFNEYNTSTSALLSSSVGALFSALNGTFAQNAGIELDVTVYPNPFFGVKNGSYIDSSQTYISMVDGGEDGEVIPIQPLLVKARGVDVILAVDASNDINDYSAGSSIVATQNRTAFYPSAYSFPPVPKSVQTFVAQNLSSHPTFFGCDSNTSAPLVIYLANGAAPPGQPSLTNTTTSQTTYQPSQIQGMLDQVFTIATQGIANTSVKADPEWPACLACAVVDRARQRSGVQRSGVCAGCFARYCWNGTEATVTPTTSGRKNGAVSGRARGWWVIIAGIVSVLLAVPL